MKTRQEQGVLTNQDLLQVVDRFLAEQNWKPSQERIPLQDLHQKLMDWLAQTNTPFAIPQRKFCRLLIGRGFRAAYANVKSEKGWSFRKIIFAEQDAPAGGSL